MAGIFLSYAREDANKAKALAKCLERAGHSVWWDRHIHGGTEYADEIEAALGAAEVIIVLWSEASSHSAWVRDEAAEGRDSGRLVPLLLDKSPAPLGFRQLQSISIAGWSGRGSPPEIAAIRGAIDRTSGKPQPGAATPGAVAPHRRAIIAAIAALALVLIAGAGYFLLRGSSAKAEPVVAVLPFTDLSPARDKAFLAEGVAEAILTGLAKEQGIKVIGRSSAAQLHEAGAEAPEMRKAMGITHVLEGSARSIGDQLRMSVRLVDADDGSQLWTEEYHRKLDNIFAVQDEIGRAVALKLRGSIGRARTTTVRATSADAYTLYLAARAKMRDRKLSSLKEAMKLAEQVIAADPDYAPGHAVYAELIELMSYDNYGTMSPERAKQLAEPHARKAIALAPTTADGYAALGMILEGEEAIAPLQKAIRLDPARGELRLWLAVAYMLSGKNTEGLREVQAGAAMEPLWSPVVGMEIGILAASGRPSDAEARLRQYEERGGSTARAAKWRADIAGWQHGDLSEALRFTKLAMKADPEVPQADQTLAWTYAVLGFSDQARAAATTLPPYTRLFIGDIPAAAEAGRRDGAAIWRQPDPDVVIRALAIGRDWSAIERLFDADPERFRLVCRDMRNWNVQMGLDLLAALRERGRSADARSYRDCLADLLRKSGAGSIRSPYLDSASLNSLWAQLKALEGQPSQAFALLEKAVAGGQRTKIGTGLAHFPAYDRFRSTPAYVRVDRTLKQVVAREAAEARQLLERGA